MNIENLSRRPGVVFAGLLCLVFLLYGQILTAPFVYDDHELLLGSPLIKNIWAPLENWPAAGTKLVAFLTFAFNYGLGGENTFGYHLVNVLLHSCNAWFLYLLIRMFFKTPRLQNTMASPDMLAALAAVIFLCHPLQTESVSYIWQRTELLSAFFYFLTLLCYLYGRLNKGGLFFMFAALFFIAGFFSKGMIVSFPLLALMLEDALFDVPKGKKVFFRSVGGAFIITWLLFRHIEILNNLRSKLFLAYSNVTGTSMTLTNSYTQLDVTVRYILLAIFPFWQNLDHAVPLAENPFSLRILFSTVFILFVVAAGIDLWKRNRLAAVGIFWFLIALLPIWLLGGRDPMAEHRVYFSMAGFALLAAVLLRQGIEIKKSFGWFLIAVVGIFSVLTLSRNHLWQSPRLLFEDTVRKSPNLARPSMMLGTVYLEEKKYEPAAEMFNRAIALDPHSAESYNNLGFIFLNTGHSMEAEDMFDKAITARENFVPAYLNLGYFALRIGDVDRAVGLFEKALTFEPSNEKLRAALKKAKSLE